MARKSILNKKILTSLMSFFVMTLLLSPSAHALQRIDRLGIGFSNQMKNDIPSLSLKIQRTKSFALGAYFGYSTDDNRGGHAASFKLYQNIFEEPNLTFYGSVMGGLLRKKTNRGSESGFQADLTLGSEFSFQKLESLGFSLEFGVSFSNLDEFVMETVGNHFLISSVHFYL